MTPRHLLILLAVLVVASIAALCLDPLSRHAKSARAAEFQTLVGGLGFGPAAEISSCAFSFDPRLCASCPRERGPLPGGGRFCPHHGFSLFHYPFLQSSDHAPVP